MQNQHKTSTFLAPTPRGGAAQSSIVIRNRKSFRIPDLCPRPRRHNRMQNQHKTNTFLTLTPPGGALTPAQPHSSASLHPEPAFDWLFRAPATHTAREKAVTESEKPSRQFSIRQATREDGAGLIKLIVALAEFEKLAPPDPEARERLLDDGFGARPKFDTLLAFWETDTEPVGYAVFFEMYSTFLARPTLFLEDLFVLPAYRKRGIGTALLKRCIARADERGCGRMEWTCLDWNTNAQCTYEKLGARRLSEWYLYRLGRDRIEQVAKETV